MSRSTITHVNGIKVESSWASSITTSKDGGHWILLENSDLWMTDGDMIAFSGFEGLTHWVPISNVTGMGKDLFS